MGESEKKATQRFEKRGGYSGSRPASEIGPPPTTPSGSVPAAKRKTKKSD